MLVYRLLLFFLISQIQLVAAAQQYNSLDSEGRRHGPWQKMYASSNQLRYEGEFSHGEEVGTFKFYDKSGGHPTATKVYNQESNLVKVTYYTTSGKKVSSGNMKDRKKVGVWVTYHQDGETLMIEEFYNDGDLDKERIVYFINKAIAQKEIYKNGKREGVTIYYTEDGKVLKTLTYKNDLLEGPAIMYNGLGVIEVKGFYKDNRKHGIWIYYKEGQPDEKIKFPRNKIGVQ
ncbi:toxin-antitoxin system YwqK family antitoxin [Dokdonia sp. Hel_I_53]|uniref:toxin-antitoxin system YwqK family antitoxin n=1 Tax=Dokdonia sp. Hel_I_53 TaxID=1566287 RepID=UPI001199B4DF|nr:toxin-antitoxin system YwqK family antitoxin [Dokdonia sp. Hel_I_53]TVZ51767.1 antitoxin component YwqK of YwqJK toxin-antitoxin module [Dokdonia sp. Hel_I_53]